MNIEISRVFLKMCNRNLLTFKVLYIELIVFAYLLIFQSDQYLDAMDIG